MLLGVKYFAIAALAICTLLFTTARDSIASEPTQLNIAVILSAGIDNGWDGTLMQAFERVRDAKPHRLEIKWKYTDPLWGDDAGDAMRLFAESGQYDIIWAHSTFSDQVKKLKDEFPDILFVVVGSGNEGLGGNQYWLYKRVHEPAYVLGYIAGKLTQSAKLGAVATFPADDVNDEINAFFAGAKSVNSKITRSVAFIESWYDPAKAGEFTAAQIATGADFILQLTSNFKACEAARILCFGNFQDQNSFSPSTVLSSAVALWDPDIQWIIEEWWSHKALGKPYAGNTSARWFSMREGGTTVAPFHGLADRLPADFRNEVEKLTASIVDGSFQVRIDTADPRTAD
ncbi:BMP family protein [Ensifer sp. ENS07]|uniref:BMP family lipoprotein n=1 Tax=Ensifer sp. ENS07 TaxID=2769274 RepID=UPI00177B5462|nr:BMP family protein [Ensifer sp. ENS07]MBD9641878.1 BMP family protein [Ensifer sp. ENS07]